MSDTEGRRGPPYTLEPDRLKREIRVDTFRAAGPGGQHVNRTESAVRIVHIPSGVTVVAADTRSQLRNREIALERLIERLRALNRVPRRRIPTRPGMGARTRRLESKRKQGARKRERRTSFDE
jgi:ribosome-associated protein